MVINGNELKHREAYQSVDIRILLDDSCSRAMPPHKSAFRHHLPALNASSDSAPGLPFERITFTAITRPGIKDVYHMRELRL
jgi:hypothetical protein